MSEDMAAPKIGVQLNPGFSARTGDDLPGVLRDVRAAGFDGIESGPLFDGDPRAAAALLDEHGLVQWSVHAGYGPGYKVDTEVDYLSALGGRFVVVSGVGHGQTAGLRPFEDAVDELNRAGERCRDAGLVFCYHNHGWEFVEHPDDGGKTGLDRLLELTDPTLVKLCVDVFWALYGGVDPVSLLERYLDRLAFVHLKDLKYVGPEPRPAGVLSPVFPRLPLNGQAEYVELGRGEVDLPGVWRLLAPLGMEWVVYEQDESALPPEEAAAISRRYLRERLRI